MLWALFFYQIFNELIFFTEINKCINPIFRFFDITMCCDHFEIFFNEFCPWRIYGLPLTYHIDGLTTDPSCFSAARSSFFCTACFLYPLAHATIRSWVWRILVTMSKENADKEKSSYRSIESLVEGEVSGHSRCHWIYKFVGTISLQGMVGKHSASILCCALILFILLWESIHKNHWARVPR